MTEEALDSLRRSVQSLTAELVNVYDELSLLHALGSRLGRLGTEGAIAALALAEAAETLHADCGWAALWDGEEPHLPAEAVRGIDSGAARRMTEAALAPLHFRNKASVLSHAWADEHDVSDPAVPQRFLAAALPVGGQSLGYLCLGRSAGRPQFDSTDQKLLSAVASLVAVELENARLRRAELEKVRLETELELARGVQRSLLPRDFRCRDFLDADGVSVPCQEVGGDYFDLLPAGEESCLLVMADVFGKGPAAALQAQMLQGMVHAASRHTRGVGELLRTLNACLRDRAAPGSYVTAFVATLDRDGRLRYVNAGHNPPLWIRPGAAVTLEEGGPLLGVLESPPYQEGCVAMSPGDLLLLYTDGISEAVNAHGEAFGDARVLGWAAGQSGSTPAELRAGLMRAVADYTGGRPHSDDLAVLAVRFRGGAS
jgi:sigma-B regulation protein RsbU (phosphoserine phosphatase)